MCSASEMIYISGTTVIKIMIKSEKSPKPGNMEELLLNISTINNIHDEQYLTRKHGLVNTVNVTGTVRWGVKLVTLEIVILKLSNTY